MAAHAALKKFMETVKGRARLGIQAYADGLLVIPKVLAQNSGYDPQEVMVKLLEEHSMSGLVGVDCNTGEAMLPAQQVIQNTEHSRRYAVNN